MKRIIITLFVLIPIMAFAQINITIEKVASNNVNYIRIKLTNVGIEDLNILQNSWTPEQFSHVDFYHYMGNTYLGVDLRNFITEELRKDYKKDIFILRKDATEVFNFNLDKLVFNTSNKKTTRIKVDCLVIAMHGGKRYAITKEAEFSLATTSTKPKNKIDPDAPQDPTQPIKELPQLPNN